MIKGHRRQKERKTKRKKESRDIDRMKHKIGEEEAERSTIGKKKEKTKK